MPTKEEEYTHKPVNKVDIVPILKDFGAGILKGNTSDLLGLPVDIIDSASNILSKNAVNYPSTGSSSWFRELVGAQAQDSSTAETAGTMVSVPGVEKAMVLPFIKLGKAMNRTPQQQQYAEGLVKKLTDDGINPETVYNLVKGYAEKNPDGQVAIKGVLSDIKAKINQDALKIVSEGGTVPLKNILDHPELYDAMPELGNIAVTNRQGEKGSKGASKTVNNKPVELQVNTKYHSNEALDILLHEVQHAVQAYSGWQAGGSPKNFARPDVEKALQNKLEAVKGTPQETRVREWQNNLQKQYFNQYQRLPGEQEARFTQKNLDLNQKELENVVLSLLEKRKTPANYMD